MSMKKKLLKKLLFVHLAIISFGLIFSNFAFATNRKMNPQDISAETEKMEMLQSEVQNLILKIENLEHSVSVLKEELVKQQSLDNGKSENQGDKNSTETTSVEKISPSKADSSLGSDLEANTSHESALPKDKKPSNNNEKSEYQDALICLKEAGVRKNKDACGILDKLTQEFPKRTEEIIKKEREIRIKLGCK